MAKNSKFLFALLGAALFALSGMAFGQPASGASTTTTTTTVKSGTVVYASGDTLIVKESDGVTREHTVPDGFTFQMNGKAVTLADLKPGDQISAVITDTKTVENVNVSQVVNGTVMESSNGSILVRNAKGQLVKYSGKDVQGRDVIIIQNGQPVALSDLKAGDKLSATIITNYPPQISSTRSVKAGVTRPPPPAPAAEAPAAQAMADKPAKLPKTASPLPALGLLGGLLLAAGVGLTLRRRAWPSR